MKATAKPLKGIRIQILALLARKPDLTVADMIDSLPNFSEKQIGDNCYQAKQDGLLSSRTDGITRKQAYSITDQGKSRIKSDAAPVKESLTTEQVKRNPFQPQGADMAELRKLVEDGAKENARLRSLNAELDKQTDELLRVNSVLRESQSAGVTRIDELSAALEQEHDEAMRLREVIASKDGEISRIALESAQYAEKQGHQVAVEQFMVRIPKHKPFVVKSLEKARQQAMRAAKFVGKAEVFAMVHVGCAVRGAAWEQS